MWVSGKYRSSEAIKSIVGCVHPLVSRILPYIGTILNKPQEQADGLVAGSLDLNAPDDVVKAIYDVSFNAVINIILQSDDHSEIQTARPQIGKLWVSLCWKLHSSTDFAFTITDSGTYTRPNCCSCQTHAICSKLCLAKLIANCFCQTGNIANFSN
ncbi:hypothetical protein JHK87_010154 [Glycine soja]|nr:hypothetical protein JHK87_010154 [Glycine soja]